MNGNVWFALDEHLQIVRELCKFLHVAIHILQSWHLMKEYFLKIWTQYIILHSVMKPCFNVQSHQCADFNKWLPVICKIVGRICWRTKRRLDRYLVSLTWLWGQPDWNMTQELFTECPDMTRSWQAFFKKSLLKHVFSETSSSLLRNR